MANKKIIDFSSGSISDSNLLVSGDPSTGQLTKVSYKQAKDYYSTNKKQTLTDGSTITFNYSLGNIGSVTIAGNRTLSVTNTPSQSFGILKVTQDSTGNRTLALPGFTGSNFALSTNSNGFDILGFYYDDSNFFWSIQNYGSGSAATGSGSGLAFLNFSPSVGIVATGSQGTWQATASDYSHSFALADTHLPSGTDGYIQFQYSASDGASAVLAFSTSSINQPYNRNPTAPTLPYNYHAALEVFSGTVYQIDNEQATTATTASAAIGNYFRIDRTGSTLLGKKSTDGVTFNTFYTYTASYSGDLYVNLNINGNPNRMYNIQGFNLTS